jgi:hypothetical protein
MCTSGALDSLLADTYAFRRQELSNKIRSPALSLRQIPCLRCFPFLCAAFFSSCPPVRVRHPVLPPRRLRLRRLSPPSPLPRFCHLPLQSPSPPQILLPLKLSPLPQCPLTLPDCSNWALSSQESTQSPDSPGDSSKGSIGKVMPPIFPRCPPNLPSIRNLALQE